MITLKATQDKTLSILRSVAGIVERRNVLPILFTVPSEQGDPQIAKSVAVLSHAPQKQLNPVPTMSYGLWKNLIAGKCGVGLRPAEDGTRHWQVISDSGPK